MAIARTSLSATRSQVVDRQIPAISGHAAM
jgi:hypothetical protein